VHLSIYCKKPLISSSTVSSYIHLPLPIYISMYSLFCSSNFDIYLSSSWIFLYISVSFIFSWITYLTCLLVVSTYMSRYSLFSSFLTLHIRLPCLSIYLCIHYFPLLLPYISVFLVCRSFVSLSVTLQICMPGISICLCIWFAGVYSHQLSAELRPPPHPLPPPAILPASFWDRKINL
jgi:hypothetical protein